MVVDTLWLKWVEMAITFCKNIHNKLYMQNKEGPGTVDVFFALIGAVVASPDLALIM